jgi:uncharacterized protein (DUF2267 family)
MPPCAQCCTRCGSLSVDEIAHFDAQLPTLIRGIYYDSWRSSETPVKMDRGNSSHGCGRVPYRIEGSTEQLVQTVLQALKGHISDGEWADLKTRMPTSLSAVLR